MLPTESFAVLGLEPETSAARVQCRDSDLTTAPRKKSTLFNVGVTDTKRSRGSYWGSFAIVCFPDKSIVLDHVINHRWDLFQRNPKRNQVRRKQKWHWSAALWAWPGKRPTGSWGTCADNAHSHCLLCEAVLYFSRSPDDHWITNEIITIMIGCPRMQV